MAKWRVTQPNAVAHGRVAVFPRTGLSRDIHGTTGFGR